jgi:hypothetical protein
VIRADQRAAAQQGEVQRQDRTLFSTSHAITSAEALAKDGAAARELGRWAAISE